MGLDHSGCIQGNGHSVSPRMPSREGSIENRKTMENISVVESING